MIRALIADDDRCVGKIIELVFEREGFLAESASSGEAALKLMEKRQYDLLLTDVEMPGMSGFELARKARGVSPSMKILGMSGLGFTEKKKNKYFDHFLVKPFDVDGLLLAVNLLLNQLPRRSSGEQSEAGGFDSAAQR